MLEEKFGIKLSKHFQKADWGVRPLSRDLLLYAALDTHYLIPLRDLLRAELEEKRTVAAGARGLSRWPATAPRRSPGTSPPSWSRFQVPPRSCPRGAHDRQGTIGWREETAARLDRPPFKVLDDERLVDIARAQPATLEELQAAGLGARQTENWGGEILEAIGRGLDGPLVQKKPPRLAQRHLLETAGETQGVAQEDRR